MTRPIVLVTPYQIAKWEPSTLERLSGAGFDLIVNDGEGYWSSDELAARADKADCILASSGRYDASTLGDGSRLKLIVKFGVGYDNIDLDYCAARGIQVAAAFGANQHAVADYAMALMLSAATGLLESRSELLQGVWRTRIHADVHGATLGILGLGRIGTEIARRAQGFDMRLLYWDLVRMPEKEAELGIRFTTLDELAREADFVSVNLPRTDQTTDLVGAAFLGRMKPAAMLINTARGCIVDEAALFTALRDGKLAAAASDVFAHEPAIAHPLLGLPNFIGTPHTAALSAGSIRAMAEICATCAIDYFGTGRVPERYRVDQPMAAHASA